MTYSKIQIEQVSESERIPYELLLLADPSRALIDDYLETGMCFVANIEGKTVGTFVLNSIDESKIEIKNIAVKKSEQGKGIGLALLTHAERICHDLGYQKLLIGTGNSSLRQLEIYQKFGFEICKIEKGYFTRHYSQPIFENGIKCKDLIILEKTIDL